MGHSTFFVFVLFFLLSLFRIQWAFVCCFSVKVGKGRIWKLRVPECINIYIYITPAVFSLVYTIKREKGIRRWTSMIKTPKEHKRSSRTVVSLSCSRVWYFISNLFIYFLSFPLKNKEEEEEEEERENELSQYGRPPHQVWWPGD